MNEGQISPNGPEGGPAAIRAKGMISLFPTPARRAQTLRSEKETKQ